jgi:lipopolysaccharide transport system ATP-binding protein
MFCDMSPQQHEALAVRVADLGKCYRIYDTPKDRLKQALWRSKRQYYREFWALRNVNFEVRKGDTLGIIGRNGSGKSTLLQMICGTLSPTTGTVSTSGRVAALLELGSGFNPEFTGIENVYLNSALLGLSKAEAEAQLDNILGFADIGDFVFQPVKTYSSGMVVRLAFAVMVYAGAEILIVDEALSVGDAFFTSKCTRAIKGMIESGTTLLFVSHDSHTVLSTCRNAILLKDGASVLGPTKADEVIRFYTGSIYAARNQEKADVSGIQDSAANHKEFSLTGENNVKTDRAPSDTAVTYRIDEVPSHGKCQVVSGNSLHSSDADSRRIYNGQAFIKSWTLSSDSSDPRVNASDLTLGERVRLTILVEANSIVAKPAIAIIGRDKTGQPVFSVESASHMKPFRELPSNSTCSYSMLFEVPTLRAGDYTCDICIADGDNDFNVQCDYRYDAFILRYSNTSVVNGFICPHCIEFTEEPG